MTEHSTTNITFGTTGNVLQEASMGRSLGELESELDRLATVVDLFEQLWGRVTILPPVADEAVSDSSNPKDHPYMSRIANNLVTLQRARLREVDITHHGHRRVFGAVVAIEKL